MTFKTSNLEELILPLRVQIGDTTTTPTYSDEMLHLILRYSVSALMPRWHDRYFVDVEGVVQRNTSCVFDFSTPPVIQSKDWRAIVLQASIMIKGGAKFSGSSSAVSWKDEEISFNASEASRQLTSSLQDDLDELNKFFPVKLARVAYGRLYGFKQDWDD